MYSYILNFLIYGASETIKIDLMKTNKEPSKCYKNAKATDTKFFHSKVKIQIEKMMAIKLLLSWEQSLEQ